MVDNVPSQANRLEQALRRDRKASSLPEFLLDLSELGRELSDIPPVGVAGVRLSEIGNPRRSDKGAVGANLSSEGEPEGRAVPAVPPCFRDPCQ